jgi:hypothetical protein
MRVPSGQIRTIAAVLDGAERRMAPPPWVPATTKVFEVGVLTVGGGAWVGAEAGAPGAGVGGGGATVGVRAGAAAGGEVGAARCASWPGLKIPNSGTAVGRI